MDRPFSQACENNKASILEILHETFSESRSVLEIGSGTGQHAVFFARHMPWLQWQTSDLPENHPAILSWLADGPSNVLAPLALDVCVSPWPVQAPYEGLFSANSLHIMDWGSVQAFFQGAGKVVAPAGVMCIYGPFNYAGGYTSESNARFDLWLKERDPNSGIRDFEAIETLANGAGFELLDDYAMPANNRLLYWCQRG